MLRRADGCLRSARPLAVLLLTGVFATGLVAGCASASDPSTDSLRPADRHSGTTPLRGAITVSAASSLTDALTEIRDRFVTMNPEAAVALNFGSSGLLSEQIAQGAPADVAAFADPAAMDHLGAEDQLSGAPVVFARNRLVIVTPAATSQTISSLDDLADARTVSLCVVTAPCGRFAEQILAAADVTLDPGRVSRGQDVRATLTAVTEGDADAAIVYTTDATVAGDTVVTVPIPADDNVVTRYPIAALSDASDPALADAFVEFVLGVEGQDVLRRAGFLAP